MNNYVHFVQYYYVFFHSCFISDIGVFFGAFLGPIILIMIFNVCIFISSSYVVIKLKINQQKRNQPLSNNKKVPMSSKDACKLLALLAGFMFLLGLSWVILMFTIIGADTNIYAAFAVQWLFVFFNSLQGFFLFVFFVVLNRDARKLWLVFFRSCCKKSLLKFKTLSSTEKTTSTKLDDYSHSEVKGEQNHVISETTTTSMHLETITDNDDNTSADEVKPQMHIKRWSTIRKTHDVEIAEVTFTEETDKDVASI